MRVTIVLPILFILSACSEGGIHYGVKKTLMGGYHGITSTYRAEESGFYRASPNLDSCAAVNSSNNC